MPSRDTQPDLLSIGETSRMLGVSLDTLRRWDAAGKLPAVRTVGQQRRFRREDVERLAGKTNGNAA
jgi:excisionase family DNA binding protein